MRSAPTGVARAEGARCSREEHAPSPAQSKRVPGMARGRSTPRPHGLARAMRCWVLRWAATGVSPLHAAATPRESDAPGGRRVGRGSVCCGRTALISFDKAGHAMHARCGIAPCEHYSRTGTEGGMKQKREAKKRRVMLSLEEEVIRALKVRAAQEGTTMSKLVAAWVRSWGRPRRPRPGGGG